MEEITFAAFDSLVDSAYRQDYIHDNDYLDDMHTLPGISEMNWDEITKALAEIDYKGDFTMETDHFFDSLCTEEETILGLRLSVLIGRKMIAMIESYK